MPSLQEDLLTKRNRRNDKKKKVETLNQSFKRIAFPYFYIKNQHWICSQIPQNYHLILISKYLFWYFLFSVSTSLHDLPKCHPFIFWDLSTWIKINCFEELICIDFREVCFPKEPKNKINKKRLKNTIIAWI